MQTDRQTGTQRDRQADRHPHTEKDSQLQPPIPPPE